MPLALTVLPNCRWHSGTAPQMYRSSVLQEQLRHGEDEHQFYEYCHLHVPNCCQSTCWATDSGKVDVGGKNKSACSVGRRSDGPRRRSAWIGAPSRAAGGDVAMLRAPSVYILMLSSCMRCLGIRFRSVCRSLPCVLVAWQQWWALRCRPLLHRRPLLPLRRARLH